MKTRAVEQMNRRDHRFPRLYKKLVAAKAR
jgi:hypothetical protein